MKKETVFIQKDGTAILQGKVCPFRTPLVLPSQTLAGQLTIQNIPCTSACPLFTLHSGGGDFVNIRCGTGVRHDVNVIQEEQEHKSNLTI
jgi:hypothetical protein